MEKLQEVYKAVSTTLQINDIYLVGGCVRDAVMGNDPDDFDFASPHSADEIEQLVRNAGRRPYLSGKKFGTIGFKCLVGDVWQKIEITQFRIEVYDGKSRKPTVTPTDSLKADLQRRDFRLNAMAYDGEKIFDPFGGKLDIYKKQLVSVGPAKECITDDALRIFRAARFAARYGFTIDPNFIGKARQLADRIFDVSVERWTGEMDKLLTSDHVDAGIYALKKMGILMRILPELYNDNDEIYVGEDSITSKNVDEAWKQLFECIQVPGNINEPTRTKRFVMAGLCSRFKFSNQRCDIILDKQKNKE